MKNLNLVPNKLSKTNQDDLVIEWSNGETQTFPVREIRLACPCAECIDEFTGKPLLNPDTVSNSILPKKVRSVGRYAIAFEFDDGHKSGIYSHDFLYELGKDLAKG